MQNNKPASTGEKIIAYGIVIALGFVVVLPAGVWIGRAMWRLALG